MKANDLMNGYLSGYFVEINTENILVNKQITTTTTMDRKVYIFSSNYTSFIYLP